MEQPSLVDGPNATVWYKTGSRFVNLATVAWISVNQPEKAEAEHLGLDSECFYLYFNWDWKTSLRTHYAFWSFEDAASYASNIVSGYEPSMSLRPVKPE